jgi:hypothetical protein
VRTISPLPDDAGHLTLGLHYLAYVSDSHIWVLGLADGTTRALINFGQRPGQDFNLRWANDSSVLAYAVAWNEPDESRKVELGVTDGHQQTVVDTLTARPASPAPTCRRNFPRHLSRASPICTSWASRGPLAA